MIIAPDQAQIAANYIAGLIEDSFVGRFRDTDFYHEKHAYILGQIAGRIDQDNIPRLTEFLPDSVFFNAEGKVFSSCDEEGIPEDASNYPRLKIITSANISKFGWPICYEVVIERSRILPVKHGDTVTIYNDYDDGGYEIETVDKEDFEDSEDAEPILAVQAFCEDGPDELAQLHALTDDDLRDARDQRLIVSSEVANLSAYIRLNARAYLDDRKVLTVCQAPYTRITKLPECCIVVSARGVTVVRQNAGIGIDDRGFMDVSNSKGFGNMPCDEEGVPAQSEMMGRQIWPLRRKKLRSYFENLK